MNAKKIVKYAVAALESKKAQDIDILCIEEQTTLAEYMVIASGSSTTQVRALAEEVEDALTKQGVEPHHIEGRATGWILLDYESVIIHVFYPEARKFYSLERLWAEGKKIAISSSIFSVPNPFTSR